MTFEVVLQGGCEGEQAISECVAWCVVCEVVSWRVCCCVDPFWSENDKLFVCTAVGIYPWQYSANFAEFGYVSEY